MDPMTRCNAIFQRFDQYELSLCLLCNGVCHRQWIERFFAVISRLGNGVFWYALGLALPLWYGAEAVPQTLHLVTVGALNVMIYKRLKKTLGRQRPYVRHKEIHRGAPPLDWYSFPSGHTLHAVAFSILLVSHYPELAWLMVPFALLVALSRVVLGLHYPSDVLAGAAIGATTAVASLVVYTSVAA